MTDEQTEALVGKLTLEHANLGRELATLGAEANRIGRVFSEVGSILTRNPQNLIFDKESHDARFSGGHVVKASDIADGKRVLELTNEIRVKIARREDIAIQLKHMGIPL